MEAETTDVDVERIIGEGTQVDMSGDVADMKVGRGELFGLRNVVLVESDAGMADNQRVDAQIEGRVISGVARGQRVEYELEIGGGVGILAVETGVCSEELSR